MPLEPCFFMNQNSACLVLSGTAVSFPHVDTVRYRIASWYCLALLLCASPLCGYPPLCLLSFESFAAVEAFVVCGSLDSQN